MKRLTGNEAIRARNASTRISASQVTMSPHLEGMYRTAAGETAEHHVEFGAYHQFLIFTPDEVRARKARPMNRWNT